MGTEYWRGLIDWLRTLTLAKNYISPEDIAMINATDDPEEAISIINIFYKKRDTTVNFA